MRRLLIAVAATAAIAGCGGGESDPASVVPKDATAYVSVDTRARLAASLPRRAWVGDRAVVFAKCGDVALVLATDDVDAARAYAGEPAVKLEYPAAAIVDGHLVLATAAHLVDAARTAADGESFEAGEPEDLAGFLTAKRGADASELLEVLGVPAALAPLLPEDGLTARARQDGDATIVELDGVEPRPPAPDLDAVPASAWLAIADGDIGSLARAAATAAPLRSSWIERRVGANLERELLPHLAAGTFFVEDKAGDDNARLVVDVRDEAAVRRAVFNVITVQRRRAKPEVWGSRTPQELTFGVDWYDPRRPNAPFPGFYAHVENGKLAVDIGTTGGASEDLPDTARYRDAERRLGTAPTLLVNLQHRGGDGYLAAAHGDTLRIVLAGRLPAD